MSFASFSFIFLFFPFASIIFWLLRKKQSKYDKIWLTIISLIFYISFGFQSVYFLLVSIAINYFTGIGICRCNDDVIRNILFVSGLVFNIALLGFFKFLNLFLPDTYLGSIAIPIAVSFITFQQISCLIDVYRNKIHDFSLIDYVLYIIYFPKIISGPITRFHEFTSAFANKHNLSSEDVSRGILLFSLGLFKKVFIADTISKWSYIGFDKAEQLSLIEGWITSLSYTLQLYFDFSGYIDMAIAVSIIFGIKLPINFNTPYNSVNLREFWHRWHITLSTFLRDYLYIPLGGNRINEVRTSLNLLLTMTICGIWHGAGWGFIIWGAFHGTGLLVFRAWSRTGIQINRFFAWILTFNFINISWIFFRSKDIESAKKILKSMFDLGSVDLSMFMTVPVMFVDDWVQFQWITPNIKYDFFNVLFILIAFLVAVIPGNSNDIIEMKISPKHAVLAGALFALSFLFISARSEFLYLRF